MAGDEHHEIVASVLWILPLEMGQLEGGESAESSSRLSLLLGCFHGTVKAAMLYSSGLNSSTAYAQ